MNLSTQQQQFFHEQGYLHIPQIVSIDQVETMLHLAHLYTKNLWAPVEFEADLQYPGAPDSRTAQGGRTPRRILNAFSRDAVFRDWAIGPTISTLLRQLFGNQQVALAQSHHNCIMTKHPGFSSVTHWHQDIRYWHFQNNNLISVWLALTDEYPKNGSLRVIPGSHKIEYDINQLDKDKFFRADLLENQRIIDQASDIILNQGDLLLFDARLLHCAGANQSEQVKYSLVFSYHEQANFSRPNTRSSREVSISLE